VTQEQILERLSRIVGNLVLRVEALEKRLPPDDDRRLGGQLNRKPRATAPSARDPETDF
jgi:hypothetical protein